MRMRIIRFDSSGWSKWIDDDSGDIVYTKFGIAPSGRVEVHGLYLDRRVNTDALRAIPIGQFEAWANQERPTRGAYEDTRSIQ